LIINSNDIPGFRTFVDKFHRGRMVDSRCFPTLRCQMWIEFFSRVSYKESAYTRVTEVRHLLKMLHNWQGTSRNNSRPSGLDEFYRQRSLSSERFVNINTGRKRLCNFHLSCADHKSGNALQLRPFSYMLSILVSSIQAMAFKSLVKVENKRNRKMPKYREKWLVFRKTWQKIWE
jgi:hypothetical protein